MTIDWNIITNAINQTNQAVNADQQQRGYAIQPWQQFLLPLQLNSNAPDVLMQQARDTLENYYYNIFGSYINPNILIGAVLLFFALLI